MIKGVYLSSQMPGTLNCNLDRARDEERKRVMGAENVMKPLRLAQEYNVRYWAFLEVG